MSLVSTTPAPSDNKEDYKDDDKHTSSAYTLLTLDGIRVVSDIPPF